jgi:hypothetical protein
MVVVVVMVHDDDSDHDVDDENESDADLVCDPLKDGNVPPSWMVRVATKAFSAMETTTVEEDRTAQVNEMPVPGAHVPVPTAVTPNDASYPVFELGTKAAPCISKHAGALRVVAEMSALASIASLKQTVSLCAVGVHGTSTGFVGVIAIYVPLTATTVFAVPGSAVPVWAINT